MSDKTIPVWLHQNDDQKIQIGVAGELDQETGAQPVEIWPEFKEYQIENFTIGDAEPAKTEEVEASEDEPTILTREEFRAHQEKEGRK